MAQPDLTPFSQRVLLLRLRASTSPGTPVVPAATHSLLMFNGQSGTEIDVVERPIDRPFYGGAPFGIANTHAFIEGEIELWAPKTPGQANTSNSAVHAALLPAGLTTVKSASAKTTRYTPVSEAIAISDAYFHHAKLLKKVGGARHALNNVTLDIGKHFKANVRIQGDYEHVTEAPVPSVNFPETVPVVASPHNTTALITVAGGAALTVWAKTLSLDTGNQITQRDYTSHRETGITARQPTFTFRLAKTALSDFNPWAVRDAGGIVKIAYRLNEGGNTYSELGIRGQIEQINESDIDGDYGWELSGRCIPSNTGGDEFYIEFGDTTP